LNTEKWIQRVKEIHGDKFDYNLVEYIASDKKVIIKCNKCNNLFSQAPYHHADGKGCPVCKESKGESKIAKYLKKKNINFDREKIFEGLFYKRRLRYDFHLTALNLLIEFDGEGHYEACFGKTVEEKQVNLEDTQRRDYIKNEWAKANNIPLLRIPYWDFDRIEELLEAFIREHTNKKEIKQLAIDI
jgi:phage FluMu protein Com